MSIIIYWNPFFNRAVKDVMNRFAHAIIAHRKAVIAFFLAATLVAAFFAMLVGVNYNMSDYLPKKALSTIGIDVMNREFDQQIPNVNAMVRNVSVQEALAIKEQLAAVPGVTEVLWLDSVVDLLQPLAVQDAETVESFYKDGHALFSVAVAEGYERSACAAIADIIGEDGALSGEAVNLTDMQNSATSEVNLAITILLPAIIVILLLSTTSWLEPVLFLAAIGVSVVVNMGTNVLFGNISFVTNSISPILQLAVSMDYAIFLLHSFEDNRKIYDDVDVAMFHAIKTSITTISASALTTLFGFLALVFMKFRIGPDLGLCLAKGIVLSFISVVVFLPALTLVSYKFVDRSAHRPFLPRIQDASRVIVRLFVPVTLLVALLIVPSFLGQQETSFIYGNTNEDPGRKIGRDILTINEQFGRTNILALLVPSGSIADEKQLSDDLGAHPNVKSVVSFAKTVGTRIPAGFLSADITDQFYSENYARLVLYTNLEPEGTATFQAVGEIERIVESHYDESYMVGESATLSDMKEVVDVDNIRVNLIAIIAIFLVIAFTFRSFSLPFILVLTIETAIWINLSIPYFTGTPINFIGYLVLNTVQLGATIDYAILLTDTYMVNRRTMGKSQAIGESLSSAFRSILVSGSILSTAGFTLFATSSNTIVQDIGLLLGRGTLISMLMVLAFLPAMLSLFDGVIAATTKGADFYVDKPAEKQAA